MGLTPDLTAVNKQALSSVQSVWFHALMIQHVCMCQGLPSPPATWTPVWILLWFSLASPFSFPTAWYLDKSGHTLLSNSFLFYSYPTAELWAPYW